MPPDGRPSLSAAAAGTLYAAIVFAAGFALGALRVMVLAPRLGGLAAVLLELPLMLAISWVVARRLVGRLPQPAAPSQRALMGLVGLVLLLGAELALGRVGFGRSLAELVAAWMAPEGLLGLAGQVAFGVIPLLVRPRGT